MRLLRKEGRLRKMKYRSEKNMDELTEFREYVARSKENLDYLERVEPNVVQTINEIKEKMKKERKEREECERWTILLNKGTKRNREEEEEYQIISQKVHEKSQKRWRESLMKAIKALDREHLVEEIEYWFEYHKLATTEPAKKWLDLRSKITEDYNCLDPKYVQKKKEEEDYRKW